MLGSHRVSFYFIIYMYIYNSIYTYICIHLYTYIYTLCNIYHLTYFSHTDKNSGHRLLNLLKFTQM